MGGMTPRRDQPPAAVQRIECAFAAACDRLAPLAPGARLLLGCSAGGDSMALLELMAARAAARRWTLAVAHVDHRQRPESAAEAEWVAAQARAAGVECFIDRFDDGLAGAGPLTEEVMREGRYELFRRRAAEWNADALALAHHADDRAETFLIRLLAGSGPTGLAAIRPVETHHGLTIVRPLLAARRDDLRAWLRHHGREWREDPTNASRETKRGWVRHHLIPEIRDRLGLDPTGRIARASELIEEEARAMGEAARLILAEIRRPAPAGAIDRIDLTHPLWSGAGDELRRQLMREWLWELRGGAHPPGFAAAGEALAFVAQARPGSELRTIGRMHIVHCGGELVAFADTVDAPARGMGVEGLLPPPKPKKPRASANGKPSGE
jgi:tRNA(Ile)-lysidine synthase